MLEKIKDVLREVFWLKPAKKRKAAPARKPAKKKAVKKAVKKAPKKAPAKPVKPAPKAVKAPAKPVAAPKEPKAPKAPKKPLIDPSLAKIGEITHYFDRIKVAVVSVTSGSVLIGDRVTVQTKGGVFVQKIWSMQIESQDVKVAKKGQAIGIKIDKPVAPGDIVYK